MNNSLFLGPIPFSYQSQLQLFRRFLSSANFHIEYWSDIRSTPMFHHYRFIYSNSILLAAQICKRYHITADLLCCPAIYNKNTCPINDLKNIEHLEDNDIEHIISNYADNLLFLSEHDQNMSNIVYSHLNCLRSKVLSWRWGLSDDEINFLKSTDRTTVKQKFYFYVGTLSEKRSKIFRSVDTLMPNMSSLIVHPDSIDISNLSETQNLNIYFRQKLIQPQRFLNAIYSLNTVGGISFNVHHQFECDYRSTYNERAIKQYSCGYPFVTDNPFRLKKEFGMSISKINHHQFYCAPPSIAPSSLYRLSVVHLNQHILDYLSNALNLGNITAKIKFEH